MSDVQELIRFPLKDIRRATNNFDEEYFIGRDGYGNVYKGVMPEGFGTFAFKRINYDGIMFSQGSSEELMVLSRCRHENIISLVGFCEESGEMIFVHEFRSTHGSLDQNLSRADLTWFKRLHICLGVARGLDYLHNGQEGQITTIHCNIESANILLDENWHPKIANLGLSTIILNQAWRADRIPCGTFGYLDPVYIDTSTVTTESDIYSFGVVLFELLCGRTVVDGDFKEDLVPLVHQHCKDGTITEIIDPFLRNQMNLDSLKAFSSIAYQCLEYDRSKRPTIIQIVEKLEELLGLQHEFEESAAQQFYHEVDRLRVPLEDIKRATKNFDDKNFVGRDGLWNPTYKGELLRPEGIVTCLFKRLHQTLDQRRFCEEIKIFSRCRHENIVSPVGFCNESAEQILVYQFITHGSLDRYLSSEKLTWVKSIQICLGAAQGLNHLHNPQETQQRVLHHNFNSTNILLDENWHAKIADIMLTRLRPTNREYTRVVTNFKRTNMTYIDPFYMETDMKKESDIYSFGVLLFEVVCSGRFHWFRGSLERRNLYIEDNNLRAQMNQDSLNIYSAITYQCLERDPEKRPTIMEIVKKLEEALRLQHEHEMALTVQQEIDRLRIPLLDIKRATKDFDEENVVGRGGLGIVYKGELLRPEGNVTCVFKRCDRILDQGYHDFDEEIKILYRCRHENIVSLVGFCNESAERILVYQFLTHGSLDKYLSRAKLTWLERIQICLGAAHGLNYLHNPQEAQHSVLHGHIKSTNVLLDENWQAKIADIRPPGLGFTNQQSTSVNPNVMGAIGYADPLYIETGFLTKESDIYSFGVVLFEVLCGRLLAVTSDNGIEQFLSELASHHYENGTLNEIIDPILSKQMNQDSLIIYSAIAYQCLQRDREKRPTILEIVKKLEEASRLQHEFEKALTVQQVGEVVEERPTDEDDYFKKNNLEHWKISSQEIHSATNEFHPKHRIGWGGFGGVYKAELFHFDVREYFRENNEPHLVELYGYPRRKSKVAVKRLESQSGQGKKEFLQEIKVLCGLNHENLVSLLGFCDEKGEMMLVYEYASNGSLDKCIRNIQNGYIPTWQKRLQICIDVAHGLNYLHKHNIQHRDIKSANILLGHNWEAMIADFGLSRFRKHENPQLSKASIVGTPDYADPKYVRTGILTNQSDIYSFGVILLEVLYGRQAFLPTLGDEPEYLVHVAKRHFQDKQLIQNIDRHLKEELEKSSSNLRVSINTFVAITYECLYSTQPHQLTMENVVTELKRAMTILHLTGVEAFSLKAIRNATNCFSEEQVIAQGTSGNIYKAELSLPNGPKVVAVKQLKMVGSYGEGEFLKEVETLSRYIHENIIPLRGFCEEENEKIIVLEHATNGSLDKHLDNSTLTWGLRLQISIGAAKGLHYIHTQHTLHGDIKSSNILLHHDWKATISDFIISNGNFGQLGYTKESDVFFFGVVLVEILLGRLAIERVGKHPPHTHHTIVNTEPASKEGEANKDEQVVFLAEVAARFFEKKKLEAIIFDGIKEQTDAMSIYTFSHIAYQCLSREREKRPTMAQVLEALENASKIHDEWESEKRLPRDYEEIIKMSKNPTPSSTITKKDLYSLLCSGILLEREKVWFSISTDGVVNEMVSARKFSYKNVSYVKSTSNRKSRFSKVAKILDISNLNIRIQIRVQYLSPDMLYGAYLVFKFCDRRKVTSRPLYVNLRYQKEGETLNAYFAEWKAGSNWLTVELFRFLSNKGTIDFDLRLEGFCQYYCGKGGIFVEGIEFQAIRSVDFKEDKELKDRRNVGRPMKSELDMDLDQGGQMAIDYNEVIKRSGNDVQNASKEDLYFLLSNGILIDNGEKLFSLSKMNKKICHMLPAKAVLQNSSNLKFCKPPTGSRCRFGEVAEIISHQDLRIKCDIETQMLSPDTTYACFLVFKLSKKCRGLKCPVKVRDLLPNRKERTNIMTFTSPNIMNLDKIKWIPNEREDGWMEVIVWETISDNRHSDGYVPMDIKLISFEGTMSGLIVYGIEFRPI